MSSRNPLRLHEPCPACCRPWRDHVVDRQKCRAAVEPCEPWMLQRFPELWAEMVDIATGLCVSCDRPLRTHFEFQSAVIVVSSAANANDTCRENLIRCRAEIEVRLPFLFRDCRRK